MISQSPQEREAERMRWDVQKHEQWTEWASRVPPITFPAGWMVRVIPPFNGALVRFRVSLDGGRDHEVSVYLDCWDRIGCYGAPYWEVYPYRDDVGRCDMSDVSNLLAMITEGLKTPQ